MCDESPVPSEKLLFVVDEVSKWWKGDKALGNAIRIMHAGLVGPVLKKISMTKLGLGSMEKCLRFRIAPLNL